MNYFIYQIWSKVYIACAAMKKDWFTVKKDCQGIPGKLDEHAQIKKKNPGVYEMNVYRFDSWTILEVIAHDLYAGWSKFHHWQNLIEFSHWGASSIKIGEKWKYMQ